MDSFEIRRTMNESQFGDAPASKEPARLRIATIWGRLAAGTCDLIVLMVLIGWFQHYSPSAGYGLANLCVTFAYYSLVLSMFSRTLGQMLLGHIVVTQEDCRRLTASVAITRSLWITLSFVFVGIPFLATLFTEKCQALHDIITHTIVTTNPELISPSARY
jgi:uncharacterized RDD family membrane protein YckC